MGYGAKMKKIYLKEGKSIEVDDEDFDRLSQHKWYLGKNGYPCTLVRGPGAAVKSVIMHKYIMPPNNSNLSVDHKDQNKLSYQKSNLRFATKSQNEANTGKRKSHKGRAPSSKYKCVFFSKDQWRVKKWMVRICSGRKVVFQKRFLTEEEAALAYNAEAKKMYGAFAFQNVLSEK